MKTAWLATPTRIGVALVAALVTVAIAWALLVLPRRPAGTGASAPSGAGPASATTGGERAPVDDERSGIGNSQSADRGVNAASTPVSQRLIQRHAVDAGLGIAKLRPRSPLERSPGYCPPDDPESMSVITGRRDAPLVDLELTGGAGSVDQLGRMLVAGINAHDETAIHALGVTRKEFEVILWREFPESRPVTHITVDDAWEMASGQSHAGVSRGVGSFGNRNLEFIRVDCGPPVPFRNFSLHRAVEIVARDPATAQEVRIHFAPSFVERHGRFKVLTFKD